MSAFSSTKTRRAASRDALDRVVGGRRLRKDRLYRFDCLVQSVLGFKRSSCYCDASVRGWETTTTSLFFDKSVTCVLRTSCSHKHAVLVAAREMTGTKDAME